jgi:hypothetical protein
MQPAQRPTLAQNGAFLNIRMIGLPALAGDLNPYMHAVQQTGPFEPFRQGFAPRFVWTVLAVRRSALASCDSATDSSRSDAHTRHR